VDHTSDALRGLYSDVAYFSGVSCEHIKMRAHGLVKMSKLSVCFHEETYLFNTLNQVVFVKHW
jgi:hypothetical protein